MAGCRVAPHHPPLILSVFRVLSSRFSAAPVFRSLSFVSSVGRRPVTMAHPAQPSQLHMSYSPLLYLRCSRIQPAHQSEDFLRPSAPLQARPELQWGIKQASLLIMNRLDQEDKMYTITLFVSSIWQTRSPASC